MQINPIFAVHISDGLLSPGFEAGGWLIAVVIIAYSLWRITDEEIPKIGVLSSAFFVASQLHLPLGITSAHLLLNGLLAVVLRQRAGVAIAVGLTLQTALFNHGGKYTLGVNICVYALPALVAGAVFTRVRQKKWLADFPLGVIFGGSTALLTVLLNFLVLSYAGLEDWSRLAQLLLIANLPVVLVEAIGVGFVVRYLGKVKPEWLE